MKYFWEWMHKKKYARNDVYKFPSKQMLIGYMLEYLFENGKGLLSIPYEQQQKMDIQELYKCLENRI